MKVMELDGLENVGLVCKVASEMIVQSDGGKENIDFYEDWWANEGDGIF